VIGMKVRLFFAVAVASLVAASSARAAGWTPPATFTASHVESAEPVPRAAIADDGTSLTVWTSASGSLVASTGDRHGHFTAPVTVVKRPPRDYAVASGAIAYEAADGIHVAVRSGHGFRDRLVATSTGSEINGVAIAADPLGGWVVAERQYPSRGGGKPYRVRALSLDAHGRLAGAVQELGDGDFGVDARPTQALAVTATGQALLVFERSVQSESGYGTRPRDSVVVTRPHGGAFGKPVSLPSTAALGGPRVSVAAGQAVVAAGELDSCGDAGCSGRPLLSRLGADGTPGALLGPTLAQPNRAFGPWAVPTGPGAGVLVFQLKDKPAAFSREAPVRAVGYAADGTLGALQTLTPLCATEPVALPLAGARALAVWATQSGLSAALAGADGRFHQTSAPAGPPPERFHSNATNRDARTAGPWAIVTWAVGGVVRVSVRRF
jgi:hypothetical protein